MYCPSKGNNIVLIGFMGAGKSTVARELGRLAGFRTMDLDAEIVRLQGRSIPEIFAEEGEAAFRNYEEQALRSLSSLRETVIATGGGVIGRAENWVAMRRLGPVVYLRARWETLRARIENGEGRPLAARGRDMERVRTLWETRLPLYAQADLAVDTDECSATEVARTVLQRIKEEGRGC